MEVPRVLRVELARLQLPKKYVKIKLKYEIKGTLDVVIFSRAARVSSVAASVSSLSGYGMFHRLRQIIASHII